MRAGYDESIRACEKPSTLIQFIGGVANLNRDQSSAHLCDRIVCGNRCAPTDDSQRTDGNDKFANAHWFNLRDCSIFLSLSSKSLNLNGSSKRSPRSMGINAVCEPTTPLMMP